MSPALQADSLLPKPTGKPKCICINVDPVHAKSLHLCLTLCNPMDYNPPGSSVHEILQVRIQSRLPFLSPRDLPDPGSQLTAPALQVDSLPLSYRGNRSEQRGNSKKIKFIFKTPLIFLRYSNS